MPFPAQGDGLPSPFERRLQARRNSEANVSSTAVLAVLASSLTPRNLDTLGAPALADWFAKLSPNESEVLKKHWGEENLSKLLSLAKEPDAEMFAQGLLVLGRDLVLQNRLTAAATIFSQLQGSAQFPQMAQEAKQEFEVLQGKGSFGARFGFASQQILNEVVRPESILLLGMSSAAFRVARLSVFGELAASESGWLTRGLGLRASSALAGSLAETTVLTLAGPALGEITGSSQNWSHLGQSWVSNALLLGSLRLSGGAASFMSERWAAGEGLLERFTRQTLPQAGMYGGILLADRLEIQLGLKTEPEGASPYLNAFFTWAHFNLGGFLAQGVLGQNFLNWERKMDFFADHFDAPKNSDSQRPWQKFLNPIQEGLNRLKENVPQVALAEGPPTTISGEDFFDRGEGKFSKPMAMASVKDGKGSGGSGSAYPREARFKTLVEHPRETKLEDLSFWSRELNVEPSNPRRTLEAMRVLFRLEGTAATDPDAIREGGDVIKMAIQKTSLSQLEGVNRFLEREYERGKAVIHGIRYLELVAMMHPQTKVARKAEAMLTQFHLRRERIAEERSRSQKIAPDQARANLEDAVQLVDEVRIQQWIDALVLNTKLSPLQRDAVLLELRSHPHASVRRFILDGLQQNLPAEQFQEWWKDGERERLLEDFKSLEKMRTGRALDILSIYLHHGVVDAAPLYEKFLLLFLSGGPNAKDFETGVEDGGVAAELLYSRLERFKILLTQPRMATLADQAYWTGQIHVAQNPEQMSDALKVVFRMKDFLSQPANSAFSEIVGDFFQEAIAKLNLTHFYDLALFLREEYMAGRPIVHGIWFFKVASQLLQDPIIKAYGPMLERLYGTGRPDISDPNEAWARLEEAAQLEDQELIFDWLRILAQEKGQSVEADARIAYRLLEHPHSMVRGPIYENFKEAGEGFFHDLWEGERFRILEDLKALGRERTSAAMAILEIFAENLVPEAARLLQKFAPMLKSGGDISLEDIQAEERRIKSKLN